MKRDGEAVGGGREKKTPVETVLAVFDIKRKTGETDVNKIDAKYKSYLICIGPFGQARC